MFCLSFFLMVPKQGKRGCRLGKTWKETEDLLTGDRGCGSRCCGGWYGSRAWNHNGDGGEHRRLNNSWGDSCASRSYGRWRSLWQRSCTCLSARHAYGLRRKNFDELDAGHHNWIQHGRHRRFCSGLACQLFAVVAPCVELVAVAALDLRHIARFLADGSKSGWCGNGAGGSWSRHEGGCFSIRFRFSKSRRWSYEIF